MPSVPIEQITTQLRPLDDTPLQAADFSKGSQQVAQAAAGLGQSVEQYAAADYERGQVVAAAGAKQVDQTFNSKSVATLYGDDQTPGYTALRGGNALLGRKDAETALQQAATDTLGGITDPLTKRLATKVIQARLVDGMATIAKHYNEQQLQYGREQTAGRISDLTDQAVRNSTDPDQFGANLGALKTEIHAQAQSEGWPIAKELQQVTAATDGVYRGVVEHMALTDPIGAQHYLDLHRDVISAATQQILDTQLRAHISSQKTTQVADAETGRGPAPQIGPTATSPMRDAFVQGTIAAESGGRNGLRSPAGALGTMQVMPATAKQVCAQLGIAYDENRLQNDPEYCNRIGRAYQDQLLTRYHGNATLAAAAYNAGTANVDKWIAANGDPRKGEITDAAWASRIPYPETRAYVPRVMAATARAAGTAPQAMTGPPQPIDLATATAHINARPDLTPDEKETAIQKVHQRFSDDQAALTQAQKRAYDSVLPLLTSGKATSLTDIPMKTLSDMGPEYAKTVTTMLERNAKGIDNPPNPTLWYQIGQMRGRDPQRFANLDITTLADKLPKSQYNQAVQWQEETLRSGATGPKQTTVESVAKATNDIAVAAGIQLQGVKGDARSTAATHLAALHDGLLADATTYHAQTGKWPDDAWVRQRAQVRATQVTTPGGVFGFGGTTSYLGEMATVPKGSTIKVPADTNNHILNSPAFRRSVGLPKLQ